MEFYRNYAVAVIKPAMYQWSYITQETVLDLQHSAELRAFLSQAHCKLILVAKLVNSTRHDEAYTHHLCLKLCKTIDNAQETTNKYQALGLIWKKLILSIGKCYKCYLVIVFSGLIVYLNVFVIIIISLVWFVCGTDLSLDHSRCTC